MLTSERLREVMHYDPDTGIFASLVPRGRWGQIPVGSIIGSLGKDGYLSAIVDRYRYRLHRLAFLYQTGSFPTDVVDHINLAKADNRWFNLREATSSQNHANTRIPSTNKSGLKGVSWHKQGRKWASRIGIGGVPTHLGLFDCPAAAHFAYIVAADTAFGEYARAA